MSTARWIPSLAALALLGCGPGASSVDGGDAGGDAASSRVNGSCTYQDNCTEFENYDATTAMRLVNNCTAAFGMWATTACTRVDAAGGCRAAESPGSTAATVWYYTARMYTQADVEMMCVRDEAAFVAP